MRSTEGTESEPSDPRAASRITIPGVQKPHWLPPVATRAAAHRSRSASGRPSRVVMCASLEPPDRRDTGHPGGAVHPDRAAPALALGAAAVLYRAESELLTEDIEKRRSVVGHLDIGAVDTEPDQRLS